MRSRIFATALTWLISAQAIGDPTVSISFVLDESGSISSSEFQLETDGFLNALDRLPADGSLEISIVDFATNASVVLAPTELTASSYPTIEAALSDNPKSGGSTYIGEAINTAVSQLSASVAESKVICLATDGAPSDSTAAIAAADVAKAAGIIVAPVGIALNSGGITFLDSIASNPPVANPADFEEFGTVVTNVCAGVAEANAGLRLAPTSVNFGTFTSEEIGVVSRTDVLLLENRSTLPITVNTVQVAGDEGPSFVIHSIKDVPFDEFVGFILEPRESVPVEVAFVPNATPADSSFDARLEVYGSSDTGDVGAEAPLLAEIGPVSLSVEILDGSHYRSLITEFNDDTGVAQNNGAPLTEAQIAEFSFLSEARRTGYVADGAAKLLLRVQTNTRRDVHVSVPVASTASVLSRLDPASTDNVTQDNIVQIPAEDLYDTGSGVFQGTVILHAEERFPGLPNEPEVSFDVTVGLLNPDWTPAEALGKTLTVRRTPVVLIHGLWAGDDSWGRTDTNSLPSGMTWWLRSHFFRYDFFSYDNWEGPSVTMREDDPSLFWVMYNQCREENAEGFACARNDVIGHSMGGLVARRFAYDNNNYRNVFNFQEGAIRRLVTLGTPHQGSGFANLLNWDLPCVTNPDAVLDLNTALHFFGKRIDGSALSDLAVNSELLNRLNDASGERAPQEISTFGIVGNTGTSLLLSSVTQNSDGYDLVALIEDTGCEHSEIFDGQESDQIVSVTSAQGNLLDEHIAVLDGVPHVGMGSNDQARRLAVDLLNGFVFQFSPIASLSRDKAPAQSPFVTDDYWLLPIVGFLSNLNSPIEGVSLVSEATAQTMPSLEITADSVTVMPGDTVTVTASVTGSDVKALFLTDERGLLAAFDRQSHNLEVSYPLDAAGQQSVWAVGFVDGVAVRSNEVTLTVAPDFAELQQLEFVQARPALLFPGTERQQEVAGRFADGFVRGVTAPTLGTVYSERIVDGLSTVDGDSPVIHVSPTGVIRALQPGIAVAVASNNGVITTRRVTVEAMYADDADGDGLTDDQEDLIGTNRYDADSDDDGVLDIEEVGTDPSDPLDSDGDGQIDALDSTALAVMDQTGARVTIRTSAGQISRALGRALDEFPDLGDDLASILVDRGLFSFTVDGLAVGESIDVTFTFESSVADTNRWLSYGRQQVPNDTPRWYEFDGFLVSEDTISLSLTDNQLGDASPIDGVITGLGGPGIYTAPIVPVDPPPPPPKRGGGAFALIDLITFAIGLMWVGWAGRSRRRMIGIDGGRR